MVYCPICVEEIDAHDRRFFPCPCGFQVCFWCYRKIKDTSNTCPRCRAAYIEENVQFRSAGEVSEESASEDGAVGGCCSEPSRAGSSCGDSSADGSSSGSSGALSSTSTTSSAVEAPAKAPAGGPVRRSLLRDVRVVRRDLCYLVGLPLESVTDESALKGFDFFGKYGRVVNIIVNRNPNFKSPDKKKSCAVYITFSSHVEAKYAIHDIDRCVFQGRKLRASYGTTKYCSNYLRNQKCNNKTCFYLHQRGADEDSFTIDQLNSVKEKSKDLTCSAILSHELTHASRICPPGVSLFGKTREQVLNTYINVLKLHSPEEGSAPEIANHQPQPGDQSPSSRYASLRQQFSALKKTHSQDQSSPPAAPAPAPPPASSSAEPFTILPSVKEDVLAACRGASAPRDSAAPPRAADPTVETSAAVALQAAPPAPPPAAAAACSVTVHPALQKEWGWTLLESCSCAHELIDWSLKALASPLHPDDGLVAPPKVGYGPSRLIQKQCVTMADLTATYNVPSLHDPWLHAAQSSAGPPPGLY